MPCVINIRGISKHLHLAINEAIGKLGSQEDLVAAARRGEPLAEELLVGEGAVDVARVPKGDAAVGRLGQDLERLLVVVAAVRRVAKAHAHAPEPNGRDGGISDLALGVLCCHCVWVDDIEFLVYELVENRMSNFV